MSTVLKTGAFGPVIPVPLASRKLHKLFYDDHGDEISTIIPEASRFQTQTGTEIYYRDLLDLLWNVKTFDITTRFAYADQQFPSVEFIPAQSGENILPNVDIFGQSIVASGASGEVQEIDWPPWETPVSSFPWTNHPLIAAMKFYRYTTTPYPVDSDLARAQIRQLIQSNIGGVADFRDFYYETNPTATYDLQRQHFENAIDAEWEKWEQEAIELKQAFEGKGDVRALKFYEAFSRQIDEIPQLKEFYGQAIESRITALDAQKDDPYTTESELVQLVAKLVIYEDIFLSHIRSERNLEMFELAGGFKNQVDFFYWNSTQLYQGYGYPIKNFAGFAAGVVNQIVASGMEQTGASGIAQKHKHDISAFVQAYVNSRFQSIKQESTEVYVWDNTQYPEEDPATTGPLWPGVLLKEPREWTSSISFQPTGGIFNIGKSYGLSLSPERCYKDIKLDSSNEINGGSVIVDANTIFGVAFSYHDFFNQDGTQKNESEFPEFENFTNEKIGLEFPPDSGDGSVTSWNDVIYSGILKYEDYSSILEFFEQTASAVRSFLNAGPAIEQLGNFKILDENSAILAQAPLYGSTQLFSSLDLEYKIALRWDMEKVGLPVGASGASAP